MCHISMHAHKWLGNAGKITEGRMEISGSFSGPEKKNEFKERMVTGNSRKIMGFGVR